MGKTGKHSSSLVVTVLTDTNPLGWGLKKRKGVMMYRKSMPMKKSRRLFTATAGARHVHGKNLRASPMRGGIRL